MSNLIHITESAYEYPLLIKQLFLAPMGNDPGQKIIYRDKVEISYKTWRERVHRLANALTSIGVKPGNTVTVMDWDSHRYLEAYYAVPMMGAVLHTLTATATLASSSAQVRVVDQKGNDVPADDKTPGEIILRTPTLTQGYLKDYAHSEKLWEGGWMHTNDVACVDGNGSLRITDRTKDVIKVGGEWLSSLEIEDIITRHESVSEVAVIGLPDDSWVEIPLAVVIPSS
jgi:acyl-CoA synthetase (AMP-forming)/AMP-acid ligase II